MIAEWRSKVIRLWDTGQAMWIKPDITSGRQTISGIIEAQMKIMLSKRGIAPNAAASLIQELITHPP